mmetsp:Transcript_45063/g.50515  ORF Transcript_45063/g.50515 Transcript_45063/m.50515 type:complete len:162 (-) Transcript_45063:130-615(-)
MTTRVLLVTTRLLLRNETNNGFLRHTGSNKITIPLHRGFSDSTSSSSGDDNGVPSSLSSSSKSSSSSSSSSSPKNWRKQQLEKIENKFDKTLTIENEEDLQPMWKGMESRVIRRKVRTLEDTKGRSGRMNIKKTDEDVWLEEGLYNNYQDDNDNDSSNNKT